MPVHLLVLLVLQLGELELLIPPPPSSAAVVAFALKFLASYGNTLQSSNATANGSSSEGMKANNSSDGSAAGHSLGPDSRPLASFGLNAARDGGLGLHHLVGGLCVQSVTAKRGRPSPCQTCSCSMANGKQ